MLLMSMLPYFVVISQVSYPALHIPFPIFNVFQATVTWLPLLLPAPRLPLPNAPLYQEVLGPLYGLLCSAQSFPKGPLNEDSF